MRKNLMPIIIGGIAIVAVLGIVLAIGQESETMEVEDTLDRELLPNEEIMPEIQARYDEVEKNNLENKYVPKEREWITSGPFQIDRSQYAVGEKIFLVIGGLASDEKGQVAFLRPLNDTHYSVYQTIPFDGEKKNAFNYYLQPQISKVKGICSIDDIAGDWRVVFRGTDYENLEFEITENIIIPGDEDIYQSVC